MKNQTKSIAENWKVNLIEKLGLEKCKAIVDGAPSWASHYVPSTGKTICCHNENHFYFRDQEKLGVEHIRLSDIRAAIANHDLTVSNLSQNDKQADLSIKKDIEDYCSDIRNHISPNTKVIER